MCFMTTVDAVRSAKCPEFAQRRGCNQVVCFGDWLMGDGCSEMTHVSGVTSGLAGSCLPVPSPDFTLFTGGDIG